MRKLLSLVALAVGCCLAGNAAASAQSVDVYAGLNALTANQAVQNIPRLGGGLFPSAGIDMYLLGPLGVGGEVAFRSSSETFSGAKLRPIYYDINLVATPITISRSIKPVIMLGIGSQSLRAYQGLAQCGSPSGCVTYANSNHLTGHLGLGVKVYLTQHIFLRPEAHFYFIRHNTEFATTNSERFGISLGYSLGG